MDDGWKYTGVIIILAIIVFTGALVMLLPDDPFSPDGEPQVREDYYLCHKCEWTGNASELSDNVYMGTTYGYDPNNGVYPVYYWYYVDCCPECKSEMIEHVVTYY